MESGGEPMTYKTMVVIEQDNYGYYAFAPELEGCQTQGETLEEVMSNMQEAVELYLETLTSEEVRQVMSRSILTTTVEVSLA